MTILEKGTRIYNRGDMANPDHFGTVIEVRTDKCGTTYTIKPDEPRTDYDGNPMAETYTIPAALVSPEDKGHGGTRIVTEAEHKRYRQARVAEFQAQLEKMREEVKP